MHIITRRANEGIVLDGSTLVTVVEVGTEEVTLDITGPDGETERITLPCLQAEDDAAMAGERELVLC